MLTFALFSVFSHQYLDAFTVYTLFSLPPSPLSLLFFTPPSFFAAHHSSTPRPLRSIVIFSTSLLFHCPISLTSILNNPPLPTPTMRYSPAKVTALINNSLWDQVTDIRDWPSEELLEILAEDTEDDKWRYVTAHKMDFPNPIIPDNIPDAPLPQPAKGSRTDTLGNLDRLPLEVVWRIVDNMDIQSFLKFARTSRHARSLCKQHPAYKNIADYLPPLLIALKGLRLNRWVPVGALWGEIQQPNCRSCGEKAHLLFVPTVDRICVNCLMYNPAYWYASFPDAKIAFALEHENLQRAPAFRDLAHPFRTIIPPPLPRPTTWLFPIKPTLKLAIQVHGSYENMKAVAEACAIDRFADTSPAEEIKGFLHRVWRNAPLGKLPCDPTQVPKMDYDLIKAQLFGDIDIRRAATWIPYLLPKIKSPVKLYRCKGCRYFYLGYFEILPEHRRYMGDAGLDVTPTDYERILKGRCRAVRTWEDLQEHIPKCLGSKLRMWRRFVLTRHPDEAGADF